MSGVKAIKKTVGLKTKVEQTNGKDNRVVRGQGIAKVAAPKEKVSSMAKKRISVVEKATAVEKVGTAKNTKTTLVAKKATATVPVTVERSKMAAVKKTRAVVSAKKATIASPKKQVTAVPETTAVPTKVSMVAIAVAAIEEKLKKEAETAVLEEKLMAAALKKKAKTAVLERVAAATMGDPGRAAAVTAAPEEAVVPEKAVAVTAVSSGQAAAATTVPGYTETATSVAKKATTSMTSSTAYAVQNFSSSNVSDYSVIMILPMETG